MTQSAHLTVEAGPDKGKRIAVPLQGVRLGRSSRNDVVLLDPLLSRHHCRLFFKPDRGGLWVTDLGSANHTCVNGQPIQEQRLKTGDAVTVGDTVLRVLCDSLEGDAPAVPAPIVDLGLAPPPAKERRKLLSTQTWLILATLVTLLALMIWVPRLLKRPPPPPPRPVAVPEPVQELEVEYEKVLADAGNIFRFHLRIRQGKLSVDIDDLASARHVRKSAQADAEYLAQVAADIDRAGFFTLEPAYEGIQPDLYNLYDLEIGLGGRLQRTRVLNRVEPDVFRAVREKIEECARNELGLWATQLPPDKLVEMARDASLLGHKLYQEREVQYGNLAAALKALTEAEMYLETIEPKPDFYGGIVEGINDCKRDLTQKYEDQNFRAERAIRLREWEAAARELRILLDVIPDRADPRNKEARRKLLDVERRLGPRK